MIWWTDIINRSHIAINVRDEREDIPNDNWHECQIIPLFQSSASAEITSIYAHIILVLETEHIRLLRSSLSDLILRRYLDSTIMFYCSGALEQSNVSSSVGSNPPALVISFAPSSSREHSILFDIQSSNMTNDFSYQVIHIMWIICADFAESVLTPVRLTAFLCPWKTLSCIGQ